MELTGISVGGGAIQITELDGFLLKLSGELPSLLILHKDAYGAVASVATALTQHKINIGHMEVSRIEKGRTALMVVETDQVVSEELIQEIMGMNHILKVIVLSV